MGTRFEATMDPTMISDLVQIDPPCHQDRAADEENNDYPERNHGTKVPETGWFDILHVL